MLFRSPPLITPFKNGKVDYDAYAGLVEFQVTNGSHGILVNGTTSEPSTLTVEERNRTVDVAIEAAGGKEPIVAAIVGLAVVSLYRHLRESSRWLGLGLSIAFSAVFSSFLFAVIHPQGWVFAPVLTGLDSLSLPYPTTYGETINCSPPALNYRHGGIR